MIDEAASLIVTCFFRILRKLSLSCKLLTFLSNQLGNRHKPSLHYSETIDMIDFDVEDDDLYSNCCGSRVKKKSLYRRVLTAAGIGPLVLLLEIVMGLAMW